MSDKTKRINISFPVKVHKRIKVSAAIRGQKVVDRAVELVEAGEKAEAGR